VCRAYGPRVRPICGPYAARVWTAGPQYVRHRGRMCRTSVEHSACICAKYAHSPDCSQRGYRLRPLSRRHRGRSTRAREGGRLKACVDALRAPRPTLSCWMCLGGRRCGGAAATVLQRGPHPAGTGGVGTPAPRRPRGHPGAPDTHEAVTGLDRHNLALVLAALSHTNGSHQHTEYLPDAPDGDGPVVMTPCPPRGARSGLRVAAVGRTVITTGQRDAVTACAGPQRRRQAAPRRRVRRNPAPAALAAVQLERILP